MQNNFALVLFAREPLPGKVKTRLAAVIGDKQATDIYTAFLLDSAEILKKAKGAKCFIAWTDELTNGSKWNNEFSGIEGFIQNGNNLGERLDNTIKYVQSQGLQKVIIIGSDSPSLSPRIVEMTAKRLDDADIVLGPTRDGGCYLIGSRIDFDQITGDVQWSSSEVFEKLVANAKARDLKVATLPAWYDVDVVENLSFLASHLDSFIKRNKIAPCPATYAELKKLDIPKHAPKIGVVMPALNEEESIGKVLADIPDIVNKVVVVDNGCTDSTPDIARTHGAKVVPEPQRGYGVACLRGIASLDNVDIVVFLDADYSDHPNELTTLVKPILDDEADMVIGSRVLGEREPGALPPHSMFGNWLAGKMLQILYGQKTSDLGPFRAIRTDALMELGMEDRAFGWTMEMQAKAARASLRVKEIPVSYRKRVGVSKITGTLKGSFNAGRAIIGTALKTVFWKPYF